jgi:hypothetical protein
MKNLIVLMSLLILGSFQQASAAAVWSESPINKLADRTVANDIRTVVETVEQTQPSSCRPAGVYYVVKLQIQKSEIQKDSKGWPQVVRNWETVNTYTVNSEKVGLPFSNASLSDAPCLE